MKRGLLVLVLALCFLPVVSAKIFIGQPDSIYNIGDVVEVDITLQPSFIANDFLTVSLGCGNGTVEIYKNSFNIEAGKEVTIGVFTLLTKSLVGPLEGMCQLSASYSGDNSTSQSFEITDDINIELDLEINKFGPGENVNVKGVALKKGGAIVNGFVEVNVGSLGILTANVVKQGDFSFNFTLPGDAPAGEHKLEVRIFEEDNTGKVSNEGNITDVIEIYSILKKVEIKISSQNIFPGDEFTYIINVYDQSGEVFEEEVSVTIYEPKNIVFLDKVVKSGTGGSIDFSFNNTPGYWKIEVIAGKHNAKKLFYVEEIEKVQTSLINNTLIVTNIGNVKYVGPLEVSIGSAVEVKQLNLKVGETHKFRLRAPDGTYSIGINDGNEDTVLGNTYLTGNAIKVEDLGGLIGFSQPLLWFFGIIILILIIVYVQVKRVKKKKGVKTNGGFEKAKLPEMSASGAEIMYGKKEDASAIALKADFKKKSHYIDDAVTQVVALAKKAGGKAYDDGGYKILLFAPSLTKKHHNDEIASRVAKRAEQILIEHNGKHRDKINFGIGVNTGEIISEIKHGEFTFTTTGKIISKAKRLAHTMDRQALLTDNLRRKVASHIKTEKAKNREAWKITKIVDRSKHEGFLKKFKHHEKK